ncbi:MAG: hypothetical protein Q4F88_03675 [Eubacteriales bacterium]|nr:hypothetical protein [Eubacteriales bacterium]
MKKMKILISTFFIFAICIMSFAGTWLNDSTGWKYQEYVGGPFTRSGWHWIDANNSGVAKCYFFMEDGYILTNTITPDGYIINASGEWVVNGIVQTKIVGVNPTPSPTPTPVPSNNTSDHKMLKKWIYYSDGVSKNKDSAKIKDGTVWTGNIMSFNQDQSFALFTNPGYNSFSARLSLSYKSDYDPYATYTLVVTDDNGVDIERFTDFNNYIYETINVDISGCKTFSLQLYEDIPYGSNYRKLYIKDALYY